MKKLIIINLILFMCWGCEKDPIPYANPTITTGAVTDLTSTTVEVAMVYQNISKSSTVGVWLSSTSAKPGNTDDYYASFDINQNNITDGVSNYISISGLASNTKYYYRAYITNAEDYIYGEVKTFTTASIDYPTISTNTVSSISLTTANCGGTISTNGGGTISARGVCWSSTSNIPTVNLSTKTTDGTGMGSFTSLLTGLTANTIYYVRAYATNETGTAYGTTQIFTTQQVNKAITDFDGNIYHTITIGTQTWMVENLKTAHYNDGTIIPNITNNVTWKNLVTGAYCAYNNLSSYVNTYGCLYNWYAVNTGKLAPTGWHIPTKLEWATLESYVSSHLGTSSSIAKALAATYGWTTSTKTGAPGCSQSTNNSSGFTALPSGGRSYGDGTFNYIYSYGFFWSSTISSGSLTEGLCYDISSIITGTTSGSTFDSNNKNSGLSVRCIRDN